MNRALPIALVACALVVLTTCPLFAQTAAPKFLAFAFSTSDHGWAGGADGITVTDDGGRTWKAQLTGRRVDELIIVRRRTLFALSDGAVLGTTDGGADWHVIATPHPALKHLAFASDRVGFGIGSDGLLYTTDDAAKNWHRAAFDRRVDAVCFSDRRNGFIGGATTAPALGAFDGIAQTSDGGRTWNTATRPPTDGLVGIAGHTLHCTRGSVYDLLDLGSKDGGDAYIFTRSTDNGRSWQPILTGGTAAALPNVPKGPGTEATSMSGYSPQAAYVAGFCGACGPAGQSAFWATDGRLTHETRLDNIGFTSAPVFTSPDHGWIGARVLTNDRPDPTDEVLITNDAGHTWTPIFTAH